MGTNKLKEEHTTTAIFLLEDCPIEEIGNEIVADIVESYRHNMINKNSAINMMLDSETKYIEKYIRCQHSLNKELL